MNELEVWSIDNTYFSYFSLEDLIDENGCDLEVGQTVYVGEPRYPKAKELCSSEDIIELIERRAYDIAEEFSDSMLDKVTKEAKQELDIYLQEWMSKYAKIDFYTVHNVREYVLVKEDMNTCIRGL